MVLAVAQAQFALIDIASIRYIDRDKALKDTIMIAFGGPGDEISDNSLHMWVYSLIFTIVVVLLFLNLLIAIISATYERVTESRDKANFSQLANVVFELECNIKFFVTIQSFLYNHTQVTEDLKSPS